MVRALLLILVLFLPVIVCSADLPSQLQFADSLAAEGDHYRAIGEYKRFLFFEPTSPLAPRARLSIAESLVTGQRWQAADSALENLFLLHPQSVEAARGRLLYANIAYDRGEFGLARERYRSLLQSQTEPDAVNYANFRIGWTFLEQDDPQKARASFSLLPQQQQDLLLEDLQTYRDLPQKSPLLAGALSTLLPGSGQVYTGRYRQAALAFLLNGAFIWGALEAIDNQNYAVGGILLFFEAGWYGGNIYNAVNNAHKFNQRTKHGFKQQMRSRLNLQLGAIKQTPLVGLTYRF